MIWSIRYGLQRWKDIFAAASKKLAMLLWESEMRDLFPGKSKFNDPDLRIYQSRVDFILDMSSGCQKTKNKRIPQRENKNYRVGKFASPEIWIFLRTGTHSVTCFSG